ncbi:hypothetical protein D6D21_04542 [Aureobasidium pullulans]|uniref:SMODS and SLOG-associating 2TM effector domain-containing protein n=1 Tax=Aureobasidium pullulans TaxID=5580 RepID=A0AB74J0N5_AURPU|nr:hypothetical protein D6D21_04542 [Aureobasidium pullulans]TIA27591.1 hypothetical protein D6C79_10593 [Aureobasidium pullulans]
MVMKKALAEDCTMLAVAAAIVAQIAITALSLGYSDTIHWTANAAFVVSLVTASLSVFYACLLQQHISGLFTPDDVKSWLSKPASPAELRLLEKATSSLQYEYPDLESASEETQSALKALRQTIEGFAQQFK